MDDKIWAPRHIDGRLMGSHEHYCHRSAVIEGWPELECGFCHPGPGKTIIISNPGRTGVIYRWLGALFPDSANTKCADRIFSAAHPEFDTNWNEFLRSDEVLTIVKECDTGIPIRNSRILGETVMGDTIPAAATEEKVTQPELPFESGDVTGPSPAMPLTTQGRHNQLLEAQNDLLEQQTRWLERIALALEHYNTVVLHSVR